LAELEGADRLARTGDRRPLTGDRRQFLDGRLQQPGVLDRVADTHVHDDLLDPRNLHHVAVPEALHQRGYDLLSVPLPQTSCHPPPTSNQTTPEKPGYLSMTSPHRRQART